MSHGMKLLELLEKNPHLRNGSFDVALEKLSNTPDSYLYAEWRVSEYILFYVIIKRERDATATVSLYRVDVPAAKVNGARFYENESVANSINMWPELRKLEYFIGVGNDLANYRSVKNGRSYKYDTCETIVVM